MIKVWIAVFIVSQGQMINTNFKEPKVVYNSFHSMATFAHGAFKTKAECQAEIRKMRITRERQFKREEFLDSDSTYLRNATCLEVSPILVLGDK